jgi:hypothetical protein
VILFVQEETRQVRIATGINERWYIGEEYGTFDHDWQQITWPNAGDYTGPMIKMLGAQIRAVCILLEVKPEVHDVVRVSEKLNASRERSGRTTLRDYHVVNLKRPVARPHDGVVTPGTRKRLHWRRAHWRHYPNHRVRMKRMLVGDIDLGFVDKEYRL